MHDPRLGFDPFAPPAFARRCIQPQCDGRLYVEPLGQRCKVYCTSCDFHEFHDSAGKVELDAMRQSDGLKAKPSWNARPQGKALSQQPLAVSPEPETTPAETPAMSEAVNKQCPKCGAMKKRLRKESGLCGKCDAQLPRGGRPPAPPIALPSPAPASKPVTKAADRPGELLFGEPIKFSPVVRIKARVVNIEFEGDDESIRSLLTNLGDLLAGKQATDPTTGSGAGGAGGAGGTGGTGGTGG